MAIDFIHKQTKTGDEEFMRQAWTYIALAMQSLEYKSKELKELFSLIIESWLQKYGKISGMNLIH